MTKLNYFTVRINSDYTTWTRTVSVFDDHVVVRRWGGNDPEHRYESLFKDYVAEQREAGAKFIITTDRDGGFVVDDRGLVSFVEDSEDTGDDENEETTN